MPLTLPLKTVSRKDKDLVGGKGLSLALLAQAGFRVPLSLCITTEAYKEYVSHNGLAERIQLEFNRKDFNDLRWEEIWDISLRIRNLFLSLKMPAQLEKTLGSAINDYFQDLPVAIRSSAPDEDAKSSSFAGLHESYINIQGTGAILDHVKLVWASLWSDAALLYRQELGLHAEKSSMSVVVQEVIHGKSSGILFTRSPTDLDKCAIEAVHGLNQGLVDGLIEPDRWFTSRDCDQVEHIPATRTQYMTEDATGTKLISLPPLLAHEPPIVEKEVRALIDTGIAVEHFYSTPQDIEWTYSGQELVILQARPISTAAENDPLDKRPWYLSLHRSLDNLHALQDKIEKQLLPAMSLEADNLNKVDLRRFSNTELASDIENRLSISKKWTDIYWQDFIPFAHGMRLFGQVYNDAVRPENPYEFVDLLVHSPLKSIERNSMMQELAEKVRKNHALREQLKNGSVNDFVDRSFEDLLGEFVDRYGDFSCSLGLEDHCRFELETLVTMLLEMASHSLQPLPGKRPDTGLLSARYFESFSEDKIEYARDVLELGRASYRLRDDDNIYLGKIEFEAARSLEEAHHRLEKSERIQAGEQCSPDDCLLALRSNTYRPATIKDLTAPTVDTRNPAKARQLVGQPAGPGMAGGLAKVVTNLKELGQIRKGDVLICDAIEPNMTFVVPLVAAIVERRGGMLIHGAIIAREYGIPCVTGITDATRLIHTGDRVNVDGYLGIVTIMNKHSPLVFAE